MKKRILSVLMSFCLIASLIPAASAEAAPVTVTVAGREEYSQAQEVFRLLNEQRAAQDLPALSHNKTLSDLAMQRAAEIALHYDSSHNRPDGTSCQTVTEGVYRDSSSFGENIAAGQRDAAEAMDSWMNSQGHRENILHSAFTQVGVGCFEADGTRTWVQLFGNSTSDTAVTDQTGAVSAQVSIRTLPEHLDPDPTGEKDLKLEPGGTVSFRILNRNTFRDPAYSEEHILNRLPLIPRTAPAVDAGGTTVAEVTVDDAGLITVRAVADGRADAAFPLYEGDPAPYTVHVTVGDVPPETEAPTEPAPTEPEEPVYTVALRYNEQYGTARVDRDTAREGETILLTVAPGEGYYFDQLVVRSAGSYVPSARKLDDSHYELKMPDGNLELEVYFKDSFVCPFVDVKKSDYFYEPVLWAVRKNITSGMDATHFGPGHPCTRAQVVTFLWSAAGKPQPKSASNPFVDVKQSDYFYQAVLWAVENQITAGMDATHFGSDRPCTRGQVVTFLWSAAGKPDPASRVNPFTDVRYADYFHDAVLWAVGEGITSGIASDRFGPAHICTRGQIVTFLYKAN